jgi:hypothetical protein
LSTRPRLCRLNPSQERLSCMHMHAASSLSCRNLILGCKYGQRPPTSGRYIYSPRRPRHIKAAYVRTYSSICMIVELYIQKICTEETGTNSSPHDLRSLILHAGHDLVASSNSLHHRLLGSAWFVVFYFRP